MSIDGIASDSILTPDDAIAPFKLELCQIMGGVQIYTLILSICSYGTKQILSKIRTNSFSSAFETQLKFANGIIAR